MKVLQIPLDSPTADEVSELLKNIEDIPPLEMPGVDGVSDIVGQPGWVEPNEPLASAKPEFPLLDTAEPAPGQTVQPPDTGGDVGTQSAGAAPGVPRRSRSERPLPRRRDAVDRDGLFRRHRDPGRGIGFGGCSGAGRRAGGEGSVTQWANDGSDVVSARADPLNVEAFRTLVDNVSDVEPLDMPGVQVGRGETGAGVGRAVGERRQRRRLGRSGPAGHGRAEDARRQCQRDRAAGHAGRQVPDGETWGEGAWVPRDIGPTVRRTMWIRVTRCGRSRHSAAGSEAGNEWTARPAMRRAMRRTVSVRSLCGVRGSTRTAAAAAGGDPTGFGGLGLPSPDTAMSWEFNPDYQRLVMTWRQVLPVLDTLTASLDKAYQLARSGDVWTPRLGSLRRGHDRVAHPSGALPAGDPHLDQRSGRRHAQVDSRRHRSAARILMTTRV